MKFLILADLLTEYNFLKRAGMQNRAFIILLTILVCCFPFDVTGQKIVRIYPLPDSKMVSPNVTVQLQFDKDISDQFTWFKSAFNAVGIKKGVYPGTLKQVNGATIIFKPASPFLLGDSIRITLVYQGINQKELNVNFKIRDRVLSDEEKDELYSLVYDRHETKELPEKKSTEDAMASRPRIEGGIAVPADFPGFIPYILKQTAPGYIFISNRSGAPYIMIFENDGTPFFYRKVEERSMDFKLQPTTGYLSRRVRDNIWAFYTIDKNYNIKNTWRPTGYITDEHELTMTDSATCYIIGIDYRYLDMSEIVPGGSTNARVMGTVVQQVDTEKNVLFEWNSWDYFDILDATHQRLTSSFVDFVHTNSIAVDYDGNVVISSRHQSECTKINRETGEIMWRLGGVNNQFVFADSGSISYQHDIRPVPGKPDHYTLFDNGNHKTPVPFSRVVEFRLDLDSMIAYTEWEFRHTPDWYSYWMGSTQRLPNGNTFICWSDASLHKVTEVTPDGEIVYEADFKTISHCYRAFRFEWDGMLLKPELILEKYPDLITLIFNKFGDNKMTSFNVYYGQSANPSDLLVNTTANYINLDGRVLDLNKTYYFTVKALYPDESESEASNEISVFTDLIEPDQNLIKNGNFSSGTVNWLIKISSWAEADVLIDTLNQLYFNIDTAGFEYKHIQVKQTGIPMIQGQDYLFEFDAIAETPRIIEARVGQNDEPRTNYSRNGLSYITNRYKHYSYEFTMQSPSDFNSCVEINCGTDTANIYIDNLSLKAVNKQSIPTITLNSTVIEFDSVEIGQYSDEKYYTFSASDLKGDITIEAPTGFEISETSDEDKLFSGTITLQADEYLHKAIFVRFSPEEPGPVYDVINHTSPDALPKQLLVSGNGFEMNTSINELDYTNNFTIHAFPSGNEVLIKFEMNRSGSALANIWDINGRIVKILVYKYLSPGEHAFREEITGLQPGLYFVSLYLDDQKVIRKLFIAR